MIIKVTFAATPKMRCCIIIISTHRAEININVKYSNMRCFKEKLNYLRISALMGLKLAQINFSMQRQSSLLHNLMKDLFFGGSHLFASFQLLQRFKRNQLFLI